MIYDHLTLPPENDEWVTRQILSQQARHPDAKSRVFVTFTLFWIFLSVLSRD